MTDPTLDAIRLRHYEKRPRATSYSGEVSSCCGCEQPWPCDASTLLDRLADLAQALDKLKEQECREALCGHDHSTQWWEVRAHNAEIKLAQAERVLVDVKMILEEMNNGTTCTVNGVNLYEAVKQALARNGLKASGKETE